MRKDIYHGGFFAVDTTAGTEVVPADLIGRTCSTHVEALLNYLEGSPLDPDELAEYREGWLARMTMPGYLDCTAWGAYQSEAAAHVAMDEMYGGGGVMSTYPIELNADLMARHVIAAGLWSEADEDGEPLENRFDMLDMHPDSVAKIKSECAAFLKAYPELCQVAARHYLQEAVHHPDAGSAEACLGHDFLLTRNGHGAGFWCRGMGEVGRALTDAVGYNTPWPRLDFYKGDDGLIHTGW
ncbi:MAG: hypothetical protein GAK35_02845 [Herbaspirillum frisingense]|uniref:Uncharacterized protein n=1 Tax=Herbaspirillum frisingense TaxID=92645 RepID=A0A7V8JTU9_9BURK|nr:MAG: hypothetical protein GAK35_02845 [Herbaspirillum frisingense]